ncbi:TEL2-interacting protein 1 [Irineochytrium annulatum]|nr:TEL2-interacting protein 1 [Irineochytrium annulatum]
MEKLGDRNQAISSTASAVLVRVGEACGFEDIFKFVFANIDYIANEISRHLRYINQNPKSPNVLIACVRIGKSDILPYINDLVDELFDAIDDVSNPALVELIFRVLDNIMDLAAPPHRLNVEDCIRTPETAAETPTPEIKAFVSWCSKMADVDDEERSAGHHPGTPFKRDHHASADEGTGESASTPREKSVMEKYALKILEKSQHFASSKGAHLRQRMLSLITKALRSLPSQSKELRPIIYSLWPIAIARLDDSEHYVVMEAIHLLDLAICLTRTFLTRYVGKDLLPRLRSLLSRRDLHDVRTHDTSRSAQIVVAVLAAIPNIVLYTHLRPRELKNLGQLVWTFMDKRCPVQVQVLAKQGIAAVERVNPDIVWIGALASSGSSVCGTPEPALGSSFRKVELPTWYREQWTGGMKRIETK